MFKPFKETLLTAVLLVAVTAMASAADTTSVSGWKKSLALDLTTTQTAYSDAWVGGEAGSLNWVTNLNGTAERQLKSWFNFRSILKMSFGQSLSQDETTRDWTSPKKSTDLIDWENLARFTTNALVDPYAALRLESQFYTRFPNGTNATFRPLKLTQSAGVARKIYTKEKDEVLSRLGLALRETIRPSLDPNDSSRTIDSTYTDGGMEWVTDASLTLSPRVQYVGKLTLFKAFYFSGKDQVKGTPYENDWKAVDVNFENSFRVQVSKIVSVFLYTQMLYDKEVSRKGRFKEALALGFFFKVA